MDYIEIEVGWKGYERWQQKEKVQHLLLIFSFRFQTALDTFGAEEHVKIL